MADSIRAIRARYDNWKELQREGDWRRFFHSDNREQIEFLLSLEDKYPDAGIIETDTGSEVLKKVTNHLESVTNHLRAQSRDWSDKAKDLFSELKNLGIPDRKFDPDFARTAADIAECGPVAPTAQCHNNRAPSSRSLFFVIELPFFGAL